MGGKGGGSAVTQDREYDSFLLPSVPRVVTALQLALLQSRIKAFLTAQPKAMAASRVRWFSETSDIGTGTSNEAGNEESS